MEYWVGYNNMHHLWRGIKNGSCITFQPYIIRGTEIGLQECGDDIFLCYRIASPNLLCGCGGYRGWFYISHTLDYTRVGLITNFHNNIHGGISNLFRYSYVPIYVHNEPLIHTGSDMWGVKSQSDGQKYPKNILLVVYNCEQKGYLLVWYLCQKGIDIIHEMRAVNTGASSYLQGAP